MFSILIPTLNNLNYLKICINSIKKNSLLNNEIIIHVSEGNDGTINYLKKNSIKYSFTEYNSGICEGLNKAKKLSSKDYVLYAHDDFYFCPEWDIILKKEIDNIGHNNFYLSGTMMHEGQIKCDYGDNYENFNEIEFLNNYKKYNYFDFQGSTWAPSVVHKDLWDRVGGLSEEFFPGSGSDPDFNLKLWMVGVRIFKGINDFKVYHFGSKVLRNYEKYNSSNLKKGHGSIGGKIFLMKWKLSIKFFKKHYLKSNEKYDGPLSDPVKNFQYYIDLLKSKSKLYYIILLKNLLNG